MSETLHPISFPLHGSRLIEASAGTGKTWTIAALYLRLVLGHGDDNAFVRSLHPSEILVMTFTRAATRELTDRIRQRLSQAAAYFRSQESNAPPTNDPFLNDLLKDYSNIQQRQQAAYQLSNAADAMDEAAIFTIDAWCQRMLREHAFDSGCLFDEELLSNESVILEDAVRDYWRQQVYPLNGQALQIVTDSWKDADALQIAIRKLLPHANLVTTDSSITLSALIPQVLTEQVTLLHPLKAEWLEVADQMAMWFKVQQENTPKQFNGNKLRSASLQKWLASLKNWALDPHLIWPDDFAKIAEKLNPTALMAACNKGYEISVPEIFERFPSLQLALEKIEPIAHTLYRHAVTSVSSRIELLKSQQKQFGFNDLLSRLKQALTGGNRVAMRERVLTQYPIAMVDEFQDTSPDQYAIFDAIYRVDENRDDIGLFLIGDPKQSIYGFRGADIYSYLAARKATEGRHYLLGTNYRSTIDLVKAVNQIFMFAETESGYLSHSAGAFQFRTVDENPVPFEPVRAHGLDSRFVEFDTKTQSAQTAKSLHFLYADNEQSNKEDAQHFFAEHCAQYIVEQLNSEQAGFMAAGAFQRLKPADIAILVKDRNEAAAIRRALQKRLVASVYLSDKDSVLQSEEAEDMLRWLQAFVDPMDTELGRAAFATNTAMLSLKQLVDLVSDDLAWESRLEQLKEWHIIWQRQGILAAIRRFIFDLALPEKLLQTVGGERRLTNVLHLAELLENASGQIDGERALIRWFAEHIADDDNNSDEHILRLESDADLVKVITIHKSKGLEYPLVFLPFASSARVTQRRQQLFFKYTEANGNPVIDMTLSEQAMKAADAARLEEELRLFYVALTRASHGLWLGVSAHSKSLHESAFGYLLNGGMMLNESPLSGALTMLSGNCDAIETVFLEDEAACTRYIETKQDLEPVALSAYEGKFDRYWSVTSFSSIVRNLNQTFSVARLKDNKLFEDDEIEPVSPSQNAAWHRFPRGAIAGQFLHEQLEWMANEGFHIVTERNFAERLRKRCTRAGWEHHLDDIVEWMVQIVSTALLPVGIALTEIDHLIPEMEFWLPTASTPVKELDALCQSYFLNGISRQTLSQKMLHGLLMGFADLVFEHEGKYWVLDYKSNSVATDDSGYHEAALVSAMAAHRYDVQGAIYMLALHRLLQSRLGARYDPDEHIGGTVFLFLRGLANQTTHGCYHLPANGTFLEKMDQLIRNQDVTVDGYSHENHAQVAVQEEGEK
ncbi:exodeoxyribonuclease V subunit beta [Undibacterium sp. RuRC25W]|uniref:exodeoxyribonuclease V subunit beta n=1 Tax=Undibacterium sp. RuRC25W TaxID=3413047 RepID=UPI003BF0823B